MIELMRRILESVAGQYVRRRLNVSVGPGTRVCWFRMLNPRRGNLRIGVNSIVNCRIDYDGSDGLVQIGNRCFIGASHLVCRERITIGDDVLISWGVTVVDHNSHSIDWHLRKSDVENWMRERKDWSHIDVQPVEIQSKVWIGFGATILKGVIIGEGAVVGAGSIVTRDIPAYTVVAGNPARVIKHIE